jgi:hypothetical protein
VCVCVYVFVTLCQDKSVANTLQGWQPTMDSFYTIPSFVCYSSCTVSCEKMTTYHLHFFTFTRCYITTHSSTNDCIDINSIYFTIYIQHTYIYIHIYIHMKQSISIQSSSWLPWLLSRGHLSSCEEQTRQLPFSTT